MFAEKNKIEEDEKKYPTNMKSIYRCVICTLHMCCVFKCTLEIQFFFCNIYSQCFIASEFRLPRGRRDLYEKLREFVGEFLA